jgi:enoyl-CoA hydratase
MSFPGEVRLEHRGAVAEITIDRPAARNALNWHMYDELDAHLVHLESLQDARVVVVRGAGGHFAAGTDVAHFAHFASGDHGVAYEQRLETVIARLERLPIPTLTVVEGYAAGAGLLLATACDLRLCTPDARFGAPIARTVGNTLSSANLARLVAHLGPARTKAMLLLADFLDADQARAAGFVLDVVPHEQLATRLAELTDRIADLAPVALHAMKAAIGRVLATAAIDDADLVREAYGSRDFAEGVRAFLDKREPHWEGR